jgi:hypothetical protein
MDNKISINADFLRRILESNFVPEIAVSKDRLKIPVVGNFLPEIIFKLDKESICIGKDCIECTFVGVLPMHISLKEFRVPGEKNRIECKPELSVKFMGSHKVSFLLHGLNLFQSSKFADIQYEANVLSVNVAGYFPENLPINLERITVDHCLEITWT